MSIDSRHGADCYYQTAGASQAPHNHRTAKQSFVTQQPYYSTRYGGGLAAKHGGCRHRLMGITLAMGVTTAAKTIDSDREGAMVGAGPLSEQPGVHQNYLTHRNGSSMSSSFKQNNISSTQQPLNRGTLGQATVRMTQESESEIEVFNIIN